MKCNNCNESIILSIDNSSSISSRNIAVKYGDTYICTPCNDAMMLFAEDNKPRIKKEKIKNINGNAKSKNIFKCTKCKKSYEGTICNGCNTPNPMYMRKPKKSKKSKKKKKI
jgi:hypothetical protein